MSNKNNKLEQQSSTHINAYSIQALVALFSNTNEKITLLHQYSTEDFFRINSQIRDYHEKIKALKSNCDLSDSLSEVQRKEIVALIDKTTRNLSCIVTQLQFHDIIRQKLEHIQYTNTQILTELLSVNTSYLVKSEMPSTRYIPIIPDIARLHIAHMKNISKDYEGVFSELSNNMRAVITNSIRCSFALSLPQLGATDQQSDILNIINQLSSSIASVVAQIKNVPLFKKVLNDFVNQLDKICQQPIVEELSVNNATDIDDKIKHLEQLYTMQSEREIHKQVFFKQEPNDVGNFKENSIELF